MQDHNNGARRPLDPQEVLGWISEIIGEKPRTHERGYVAVATAATQPPAENDPPPYEEMHPEEDDSLVGLDDAFQPWDQSTPPPDAA